MSTNPLKQLILILLDKTEEGTVGFEELRGSLRITSEAFNTLLDNLVNMELITRTNGNIQVSNEQRLRLAIKAVELGADFEGVSRSLGWLEFEEMVAHVFEENDFRVFRRFRFSAEGRRWEMDILANRAPYIICAECKHWTTGIGNSSARKIIENHLEKTKVFSKNIEKLSDSIHIKRWKNAVIIPMILTLTPTPMKIYRKVPSVFVLALPRFLSMFEGELERITHFHITLPQWKPKPSQTLLRW